MAKIFIQNTQKINEEDRVLKDIYDSFKSAIMLSENSSKPVKDWEWRGLDSDFAAKYILEKRILQHITNYRSCNNVLDCVAGFSYLNKEDYEHINFRRNKEYARYLVGIYNAHVAFKLTDECKKNKKTSVCGILIVDINNKDGPNTMGYDVFKFAFYGDGAFLPYGIYWDRNTIENECTKENSGESCAAKIMLDGWVMKKGGKTPYFKYVKDDI